MARELSFVLPSGVEMVVRSLRGSEQETITTQGVDMNDAFNQMLADCTIRLGDNNNVNRNDIERMLVNDRVYSLVKLRQFSLNFQDTFEFSYEWPVREDGVKETTEHEIAFNQESFPVIPYLWMKDNVVNGEFVKMYESYSEMIEANGTHSFEDCDGNVVTFSLLTGATEKQFSNVAKKLQNANLPLRMRSPKYIMVGKDGNKVPFTWDPSKADILDTEKFRKKIKEIEGSVDTMLTIEHPTRKEQVRVNLIATVDFFFPSQAI